MVRYFALTIVGFYLLIKGSDLFVDGISSFSSNIRIPKLIISLTIVAFGTSTPELFISFRSLLSGNGDIVMANVVGSTIVNTMLVIVGTILSGFKIYDVILDKFSSGASILIINLTGKLPESDE